MSYSNPSVSDFKTYFTRDFPYGSTDTTVMDTDIQKAIADCDAQINQDLFDNQAAYNIGYYNLTAHNMVMNLRASSQGIQGKYSWLQNSKSVGSVSEGLSIPEKIMESPELSMLTQTNYGTKYLFMIYPNFIGRIFTVCGRTLP